MNTNERKAQLWGLNKINSATPGKLYIIKDFSTHTGSVVKEQKEITGPGKMHHGFILDTEIWGVFQILNYSFYNDIYAVMSNNLSIMYENIGISQVHMKHRKSVCKSIGLSFAA